MVFLARAQSDIRLLDFFYTTTNSVRVNHVTVKLQTFERQKLISIKIIFPMNHMNMYAFYFLSTDRKFIRFIIIAF